MNVKKAPNHEQLRHERIDKQHREKRHKRRANESLRRIQTFAKNIRDVDEYTDDLDELYEDE